MKSVSTVFLKIIISLFTLAVLVGCVYVLPTGILSDHTGMYRPILIGMYFPAFPFFIAVYHTFQLLRFIEQNKAFSKKSIRSLSYIQYNTLVISLLYMLGLPYIYVTAKRDDAPGVMLIGLIFTFTPLIIAVFASVLKKVLRDALKIQSENDLIV